MSGVLVVSLPKDVACWTDDPTVSIEDVAGAVKELIQQGKVKYFGLSKQARKGFAARLRFNL